MRASNTRNQKRYTCLKSQHRAYKGEDARENRTYTKYTSEYYHNVSYDERLKNAIKMIINNKAWLNIEAERLNSLIELKKKTTTS